VSDLVRQGLHLLHLQPEVGTAGLVLDITQFLIPPGESFQFFVGRVNERGSLVMNRPIRLALLDEDGEVREARDFVPAEAAGSEPSLVLREMRLPEDRGTYALEVSAPDDDSIDPVEDYVLVESPEEMDEAT
jgi:hypothetical protein